MSYLNLDGEQIHVGNIQLSKNPFLSPKQKEKHSENIAIAADNGASIQHGGSHSGYASEPWNGPFLMPYLQEACNVDDASDQAWTEEELLEQLSSNRLKVEALHAFHEQEQTGPHCIDVQLDLPLQVVVALGVRVGSSTLEHLELYNLCSDHC